MHKNTEYTQAFDGYDNEQIETQVIEHDTEDFESPEVEDIEEYFDDEDDFSDDDSYEQENQKKEALEVKSKKPEKDIDLNNHDLRLINAYFQEVSTEPLLTPQEEALVAAKIKMCDTKAKQVKQNLEKVVGKKLDDEPEKLEFTVNELLESQSSNKIDKKALARIKSLVQIYKATKNKGMQLRNRFVKSNLRLVASMAKRYAGRGIPFLDLIQEGNLGLIKAVERFDHSKGFRFSTYACWWINQAMTRGVFNQTRTVKMPAYLLEKAGKVRHIKRILTEANKKDPLPEEIAEKAQMSVENVKRILESSGNRVVRLDTPVYDGEKATYLDYVEDTGSLVVDSMIAEVSIPSNINTALDRLSERERDVVKMRFGIGYENAYTLDEIGRKFKLTRERIRQIEKKALERIKRSKSAPVLRSLMDVYNH